MKVAVITDTHWGARNDHQAFAQYFIKFYDEVFFPKIDELGIKHVLHLGDLTDRRKYINFVTAKNFETHFMKPLYDRGIRLDVVAGNHDTFYKNTNEINSLNNFMAHPSMIMSTSFGMTLKILFGMMDAQC